jgi:hypothetical protein
MLLNNRHQLNKISIGILSFIKNLRSVTTESVYYKNVS